MDREDVTDARSGGPVTGAPQLEDSTRRHLTEVATLPLAQQPDRYTVVLEELTQALHGTST